MKIAWFCIPAHGHTNPTLGLVRELVNGGHDVYYFSFEMFRERIKKAGARFISCDGCDFALEGSGDAGKAGKDLAFSIELLVSTTLALDEMVAREVEAIRPDLIISDSVAYWGKLTAMKYGIPYVSSTTTFAFNKASAAYFRTELRDMLKMLVSMPGINRQLQRLRDHGYPVKGVLDIIQNNNDTNTIVYTSKYYQPRADTFSDKYCFIGPSVRPVEKPIAKTAEKTIFISMGTIVNDDNLYKNCVEALKAANCQVIISLGTSGVHFDDLPDHIQVYETVDQMAVLSISDAFITHCGMNSASEGLYFEVPLVLCPRTPEQGVVARRTEELGAGVALKSSRPADILRAVDQVLNCPEYKQAARRISASFKRSGGVEKARLFLETIGQK